MEETNVYDGEIKVTDTVNRNDVVIHFIVPLYIEKDKVSHLPGAGTRRYGKATKYMPRKKVLKVKVNGFGRLFTVDEEHCLDALVGPKGDRDKMKVVW